MGGNIMTTKGLKRLEIASGVCFVLGFFMTAGAGDLRTVLIGLPIFAFAAWGFNRIDKEKKNAKEEKR